MATSVRTLDEGAWVSVNGNRILGASHVWKLADHDVCDCETAFFVVELFTDVGVDGRRIETRAGGRCIGCGESGTTGWLRVASVANGDVRPVDADRVTRPARDRRA